MDHFPGGPRDAAANPSVSVALCTYNGQRFLPRQLASILRQTRLPDEVIICDDGSTDETIAIVEHFAQSAPFPVHIHVNTVNLGSLRNFEQAMHACKGEFIALSDQDDIWRNDRLELSEQELILHPEAGLVFSDGDVIDDDDRKVGIRLWQNFEFDGARKEALRGGNFVPMARKRFVTGATVMFRSCYLPYCFPVGAGWIHDGWMAAVIASMASIRMIDEPLIAYRRHTSQQIGLGPGRPTTSEKTTIDLMAKRHWSSFKNIREDLAEICTALAQLPIDSAQWQRGAAHAFQQHHDFLAMRLSLPQRRLARIPIMLRFLQSYSDCAMGWLSVAKDFALPKPPGIELWRHDALSGEATSTGLDRADSM
jgi:glycosyltransferase involved in cell wall biosynthesis